MKYFELMYSGEYAKKIGKYGSLYDRNEPDEYFINDFQEFPKEKVDKLRYKFERTNPGKILADYPFVGSPTSRIVSQKMFDVLTEYIDPNMVYFHPITVQYDDETVHMYIMHFNYFVDAIDIANTRVLTDGRYWKPMADETKLVGIHVFLYGEDPRSFCISEEVYKQFKKLKVTGCHYEPMFK